MHPKKPKDDIPAEKETKLAATGSDHKWYDIATRITSPLNFFALSGIIIEGILGLVVAKSGFSPDQKFEAFCIMAALFAGLIAGVFFLTYHRPENLSPQMAEAKRLAQEAIRNSPYAAGHFVEIKVTTFGLPCMR